MSQHLPNSFQSAGTQDESHPLWLPKMTTSLTAWYRSRATAHARTPARSDARPRLIPEGRPENAARDARSRSRARRFPAVGALRDRYRAVLFIPMPMPMPFCRTCLNSKRVQYEVCRTFLGRGMDMNIAAHGSSLEGSRADSVADLAAPQPTGPCAQQTRMMVQNIYLKLK